MTATHAISIYCDTDTLLHNVRHEEAKTLRELAALKQLLAERDDKRYSMLRSRVNLRELMATKDDDRRQRLLDDYEKLEPIPLDEKVLGFYILSDQLGGQSTIPLVSDVQDEHLRDRLMRRGLGARDADHIAQAITNGCGVFLTRDESTIIKPHRQWIETEFPNLKVRLPSELLEELRVTCRASSPLD